MKIENLREQEIIATNNRRPDDVRSRFSTLNSTAGALRGGDGSLFRGQLWLRSIQGVGCVTAGVVSFREM